MKHFYPIFLRFRKLVALLAILLAPGLTKAQYCTTGLYSSGCIYGDYIDNFTLGSISQTASGCSTSGYGDFTATLSTNLQQGTAYTWNCTFGYPYQYVSIWIDFNNNNSFGDAGELVYASTTYFSGYSGTGTFTLPCTAALGTHRMRVRNAYFSSMGLANSCTQYTYGEASDYTVNVTAGGSQAYVSSTTTQTVTSAVQLSSTNNQIIGIQVVAAGCSPALTLNSFTLNSNGSTNFAGDVTNVKIYTTGTSPTFATTTLFGSATNLSSPITGAYTLSSGTNYFWVTYDISSTATVNDVVDAECTAINLSSGTVTPSVTAPAGNRPIGYCTPVHTIACTSADYINNVSTTNGITNISNLNSGCNGQPNNYIFYNTMTVTQMRTLSFNLTMQSGTTYAQGFGVWIDWNKDGDFYDPGENVYSSPNAATTPFTTTVTVPSTATLGTTRMRIRCTYFSVPTDPCNSYGYGETEDYNVNVLPLPAIDAGANALIAPVHNSCYTTAETVTVRIKNYGSGPIDYSTNPVTVNASVAGPNPATFTPVTLTSGILPVGGTQNVVMSTNYNMSVAGNYIFSASAAASGDGYAGNDAMPNDTVVVRNPLVNASNNTLVCQNDSVGISVATTTYGNGPIDTLANTTPMPIPDAAPLGASSVINVPLGPTSASSIIAVKIDSIYHTYDNQLSIYLYAPNGSFVDLSSNNGAANDNYVRTTFIASATGSITAGTAPFTGNFRPEQAFTNLTGGGSGNWSLKIIDPIQGDVGTLYGWSIVLPLGNSIVSYSWSPSTGLSSSTVAAPMASPGTTTTYYVTAVDVNGCSNMDSVTVTVNPSPVVSLGVDTGFCNNGSMNLDAGPGMVGYTWSTGATTQTISVNATGLYSVTVMDANLCTNSDTVMITEYNPVVNLGPDVAVCQGNTVTLNAGPGFSTYTWSNAANTQQTTVNTGNTYYVSVMDTNNCPASDTIVVTVNALPVVNLGSNNVSTCQGNPLVLNAGPGFTNYSWSTTDTTQQISVNTTGTYSVSVTDTNGCSNSDTVNVTVNPLPAANLGPDVTQCGGTVLLDAGPGNTYMWSTAATTQTINTSSSGTFYVDVTNSFGCQASDTITVTINSIPTAFAGNDTTICSSGSITLNGGAGYSAYLWQYGAFSAASQMITVSPGTTTTYSLTVTDNNGCTSPVDVVVVTVEPLPVANFTYSAAGTSVSFTNNSTGNLNLAYQWNFGDMTPTSSLTNPSHTYASNGYYTVMLIVTTDCGADTSEQLVPITVGVEEVAGLGSLLISPNPSDGMFNISIKDATCNELMIDVIDIQGKVVYSEKDKNISPAYQKQLNLSGLAKGVYYLRLNSGTQVTTQKLIIQ